MAFAEREARRWKGKTEEEISKTINYHKEVGIGLADLSGTDHAWCASFVNYCLKQAGYAMTAIPCARSFSGDANFTEVEEAVFGAITLVGTHHVPWSEPTMSASCMPWMKNRRSRFSWGKPV